MLHPCDASSLFVLPPEDIYRTPYQCLPHIPQRRSSDAVVECQWCQGGARMPHNFQHQYLSDQLAYERGDAEARPMIVCLACYFNEVEALLGERHSIVSIELVPGEE